MNPEVSHVQTVKALVSSQAVTNKSAMEDFIRPTTVTGVASRIGHLKQQLEKRDFPEAARQKVEAQLKELEEKLKILAGEVRGLPNDYLEYHRFNINKDSMKLMKTVSSELQQDESLKVRGVSFWGSRIKGLSKKTSDLDMAIFYDGSNYPEDQYIYNPDKLPNLKERVDAKTNHENTIRRKAATLVAGKLPIAKSLDDLVDSINTIDISPKNLDYLLEDYKSNFQKELSSNRLALVSLFLLGVGDGLYQARKYILDKLGNNDTLFSAIMHDLSNVERPQSNTFFPAPRSKPKGPFEYLGYPQTISEARNYFLLK